eukprot:6188353-Pleurochrysis_carterae.AAC.4
MERQEDRYVTEFQSSQLLFSFKSLLETLVFLLDTMKTPDSSNSKPKVVLHIYIQAVHCALMIKRMPASCSHIAARRYTP